MNVRVRYPPSPTGLQHIGNVRSALFNYFFARTTGGRFILRIEDTDQTRSTETALQDLYDTFAWLGIAWDEGPDKGGDFGPYVQSQRVALYAKYAARLIESEHAYRCFCSAERLETLRNEQEARKEKTGYDGHCRNLTPEEIADKQNQPHVVRFKMPGRGETTFRDSLLGEIAKKNEDLPADPILLKTDGFPTYHLANVVDDHLMEITHILRAQEWLPSVPLHVLLYEALGWEPPVYCHLPMVLGKDGQKLSKRHGSTALKEYRDAGYLPEAIINYLTLLGWSYDDRREFFTKQELEKLFTIEKLNKAPAVFDPKKLEWFNGQYIRMKSDQELMQLILPFLVRDGLVSDPLTESQKTIVSGMMPLVKERLRLLPDVSEMVRFLFEEPDGYSAEDLIPKKLDASKAADILNTAHALLENFADQSDEQNEQAFRDAAEKLEVKLGSMLMPVRVAVTGTRASPPLFGSLRLLGSGKALQRIDRAIGMLNTFFGERNTHG